MMITLPTNSLGSLKQFLHDRRDVMFRYMMQEIGRGIRSHSDAVDLLQFGETNLITLVYQPQYGLVLRQALDYFKSKELYEDAASCRDFLREYYRDGDVEAVDHFIDAIDTETKK